VKNNYLYVYLARLDKKGIKVLTSFQYNKKIYPTKIENINDLNLNPKIANDLSKQVYDNRMNYILYFETAESFNDLRSALQKRGYSNLPSQQFTGYTQPTLVNEKALITKSSTMFRKQSDARL